MYYPAALNEIRKLAIQSDIENRKIDGKSFLAKINIKNKLFDNWHISYLGEEKYKKYLNQKYFKQITATSIQKAARFFVIEYDDSVELSDYLDCIKKISDKFSNKEHRNTPDSDRFCPYLYLCKISDSKLIELKKALKSTGLNFIDGFGFLGDDFDVERVCASPNKNNMIKLKVLNNIDEFNETLKFNHKQSMYVFEFYCKAATDSLIIESSVIRNKFKISTISSIREIIK